MVGTKVIEVFVASKILGKVSTYLILGEKVKVEGQHRCMLEERTNGERLRQIYYNLLNMAAVN